MHISDAMFEHFKGNPATTAATIRGFEATSGIRLREDYAAFLMQSNGGEGFIGEGYAMLWRLEELLEKNDAYKVDEYAPGLFLFGSDGGGEAFAFDIRSDKRPIVSVPFIPLNHSEARFLAMDFESFIHVLFTSRGA